MSLIESISMGAMGLRADISGTPAPWDDYWYNPLGSASATGMRVSPSSAMRVAAVLACVGIISRNVGMFPLKVFTDTAAGGKRVVRNHPLFEVLYISPNKHQTAFEFKQMMQAHLELRGNAYAEIIPGPRGAVDQLVPLHPDRVHPERVVGSGAIRYKYNDPLTNQVRVLLDDEVFKLRNLSDDGIQGQSTVALGCDVFGKALAAQDYAARFFKNDAKPGGIIEGANFKTKDDEKAFSANWQRSQTGANRHKTAILSPGMSYKEIGVNPSDAQLLEAQQASAIEICGIFGVYPHMIGIAEKAATFASVEQFTILFAQQCLHPRLVMWEQAIQRDLILNPRYYAKFNMGALLRGDSAARGALYQSAISYGWMSPNDARELEDMNPVEDGDTYFRPANLVPLGQVSVAPSTPATPMPISPSEQKGQDASADTARLRLLMMATSTAERCVRKECAALRRMSERKASQEEVTEFYEEHASFVAEVLRIDLNRSRFRYMARAAEVADAIFWAEEATEAFGLLVERVQAEEAAELAEFAMEGIK